MRNPTIDSETQAQLDQAAARWAGIKATRLAVALDIKAARNRRLTLQEIASAVGCSGMTVKRLLSEAEAHQAKFGDAPRPEHTPETDTSDEAAPMVLKLLDDPAGVAAPIDLTGYTKRVEADGSVYWTPLQQDGRVRKPKNEIYESTANEPRPPLQPKRFR